MARQFDRERELHGRIDELLRSALPEIEAIEVELNEPQQKVTVFIDRAEGIGLEHCEAVTHVIRDTCSEYELEVSSPGIERPLRSPDSFRSVVGEQVRLRQHGRHRASLVRVVDVDDAQGVTVQGGQDEPRLVPFDEITRCRLVVPDPFAHAAAQTKEQA